MLVYLNCPSNTELSVLITDNAQIARLNEDYLGHTGPTNVLSFAQQEGIGPDNGLLGDVVVSVETAYAEAKANNLDPTEHLLRLMLHGTLHLLGHHHEQGGGQAKAMAKLTEETLAASAAMLTRGQPLRSKKNA